LITQLLFETHQEFAKCVEAARCPRLVPRKETKPPLDLSWMCTTDAFQGFKKLTHFPTVALAVSQSNVLVEGKVYDAPAGWHWATAAEVEAVPGWEPKAGTRNYWNRGGWVGSDWEGVYRSRFAVRLAQAPTCQACARRSAAPTADLSRFVSVGTHEGVVTAGSPFGDRFAGIVCIQD
jgi:hypothetical protein